MIRALLGAFAIITALAGAGAAEDVTLPNTRAVLHLDAGWKPVAADGVVAGYRKGDAILAVTRAQVPNPDAWRSKTRQAYADAVERGLAGAIHGYKRKSKKLSDANGVPALDVEARREGGAVVIVRVLLFRTYALSLAIETPARDAAAARAIATSFGPPAPVTDGP